MLRPGVCATLGFLEAPALPVAELLAECAFTEFLGIPLFPVPFTTPNLPDISFCTNPEFPTGRAIPAFCAGIAIPEFLDICTNPEFPTGRAIPAFSAGIAIPEFLDI